MSVLFCDLVGSTALSSRLDPEDLDALIRAYQRHVAEAITRFGGFLARYLGDGVLAYFGWPKASEVDAEQALRAALAAVEAVAAAPIQREALSVRIGIATGLVVVGGVSDAGEGQEHTAIGETPNRAARLQALAEPGGIVIDVASRRLVGGLFAFREMGRVALKGLPEPVEAFELRGEQSGASRFEALRAAQLTRLVGREEELELLLRRWRQARQFQGRVVLISGEPGIGKSRLLAELDQHLSGEAFRRLSLFCSRHAANTPLFPVIRQIELDAGFTRTDSPAERAQKLRRRLEAADTTEDDLALLAELLHLPRDGAQPLNLSPQRRKERTLAALLRRVERMSATRPVLILFEDLQWTDPTTRELLDEVIHRIADIRVLLVATFRPEFTPPWTGHAGVTTITLSRLDQSEAAALASQVSAQTVLPGRLLDQIYAHSDGVPLFIEELTKAILESSPDTTSSPLDVAVPASLQASLMARLDRMPSARLVAQIGSVFGREFPRALLEQVAGLPSRTVDDALGQLAAAGVLFRRGEDDEAIYVFKHALLQDAAYDSLLRSRRVMLHRAIGEALEADSELAVARPALLGHHFGRASDAERASLYFLRAGEQSLAGSAMSEAEAHLRRGLALAGEIKSAPDRTRRSAELTLALGNIRMAVQGIGSPAHRTMFAKAAELCRSVRPLDAAGERLLARALFGQWSSELQAGNLRQALRVGQELYEVGGSSPDPALRAAASGHAVSYMFMGRLEEATAVFRPAMEDAALVAHVPAAMEFGFDPTCHLYAQYARSLALQGHLGQARELLQFALDRAARLQHLPTIALTGMIACTTSWTMRDHALLARLSADLFRIASEEGYSLWRARGLSYAGWIRAAQGEPAAALPMLDEALREFAAMRLSLSGPHTRLMRADVLAANGQQDLADAELDRALALCARTGEVWPEAEVHRRKGELRRSDPQTAGAYFRQALAIAERQGARLFALRAAVSMAQLFRDMGCAEDGHAVLRPVYDSFREGLEAPDLDEARTVLET